MLVLYLLVRLCSIITVHIIVLAKGVLCLSLGVCARWTTYSAMLCVCSRVLADRRDSVKRYRLYVVQVCKLGRTRSMWDRAFSDWLAVHKCVGGGGIA